MITELILSGLFGIADIMLGLLPPFEWTIDTGAWEFARSALSMIAYLLPWGHVSAICSLIITVTFFRIGVSVMRFIKGLIPFVS